MKDLLKIAIIPRMLGMKVKLLDIVNKDMCFLEVKHKNLTFDIWKYSKSSSYCSGLFEVQTYDGGSLRYNDDGTILNTAKGVITEILQQDFQFGD